MKIMLKFIVGKDYIVILYMDERFRSKYGNMHEYFSRHIKYSINSGSGPYEIWKGLYLRGGIKKFDFNKIKIDDPIAIKAYLYVLREWALNWREWAQEHNNKTSRFASFKINDECELYYLIVE